MTETKVQRIDCRKCRHYFVTWNPNFPFGCRAMGFSSKQLPSLDVFMNSGMVCKAFEEKRKGKPTKGLRI